MTSNCSDTKAIADPKNNYQKGTNAILRINLHKLTIDYIFTYVATKTNNKSIQANFNVRLHSGCVELMLNNPEVQELIAACMFYSSQGPKFWSSLSTYKVQGVDVQVTSCTCRRTASNVTFVTLLISQICNPFTYCSCTKYSLKMCCTCVVEVSHSSHVFIQSFKHNCVDMSTVCGDEAQLKVSYCRRL